MKLERYIQLIEQALVLSNQCAISGRDAKTFALMQDTLVGLKHALQNDFELKAESLNELTPGADDGAGD